MNEYLDKLPEISDRTIPDDWQPEVAGKELHEALNAFRKVTGNICRILWIARAKLSIPGHRTDINGDVLTYHQWLQDNGVNPRTASRWLERYDPLTNTIQESTQTERLVSEDSTTDNKETNSETESPTSLTIAEDNVIDVPYENNTYVDSLSISLAELNHPQDVAELDAEDATEVVKLLEKISRKATRIKNEIQNRFAVNVKTQLEKDLFKAAKESFVSKNSFELNWKLEVPKLWNLVSLSMKAEDPPAFLKAYVQTAYDLTQSGDKFWNGKPFLPSAFVTPKMEPYILKAIDNSGNKEVKAEVLADIKEIFSS